MKTSSLLTLASALLIGASAFTSPASAADDDGFVSLFNGRDLTGWTASK
jgi:hypothetical protein